MVSYGFMDRYYYRWDELNLRVLQVPEAQDAFPAGPRELGEEHRVLEEGAVPRHLGLRRRGLPLGHQQALGGRGQLGDKGLLRFKTI